MRTIRADSHLYLIDGSAFLFRAFHAYPQLTRKDGMPTGAVTGYCQMVWRILRKHEPSHIAVIFDAGRKTFRNEICPHYKANRKPTPDSLAPQFALVREATRAFGIQWEEMTGYEADDLIATYATQAQAAGARCTIVSSDKDLMQLVSEHVEMLDPIKDARIGMEQVFTKFGVMPDRMVDYQALVGDAVDNVPGVAGIGAKTAAVLLNQFGSLDGLLARLGEITRHSLKTALTLGAVDAHLSRRLVTLDRNVPGLVPVESFGAVGYNKAKLLAFLDAMEIVALRAEVEAIPTWEMDECLS